MSVANIAISIAAVVLTLLALKKGINLGVVMLLDAAVLALLTQMPADAAVKYALKGAFSDKTISLVALLFLIMMLENTMRTTGMIKSMVDSMKELAGNSKLAAGFLPAVLGLLPSPGGARFSCPMVEEVMGDTSNGLDKAFINYWFRHIWLDGFLLYPGMILAAGLVGVTVIGFFARLLPFIAVSIVLGIIFGMFFIRNEKINLTRSRKESLRVFTISILPIIILICMYVVLLSYTPYALEISTVLVLAVLFVNKKYSLKRIAETAKNAFPVKLVIIIVGVMAFKEVLFGSGVVDRLPGFIDALRIPPVLLFVLLPFLIGASSGITINFVSMTFPILIPLGLTANPWYAVLAFIAGNIGVMITPLHLCAVMSADYFKQPLGKLLLRVASAEFIFMFGIVATIFLIR